MADATLAFDILARDKTGGAFKKVEKDVGSLGSKFKTVMAGMAGAIAGVSLVSFFKDSFAEAQEAQKVGKQTEAVIKSMGASAWTSSKQIGDLAESLSKKAGIDDELIQSGQNVLLTFGNVRNEVGKGNQIFDRATEAALDLSVAMGQDMESSVVQLGKALNDPIAGITALTRVGVSFTAQQKDQIKALTESGDVLGAQKIILGELEKQFAGSAEAQATSADKAAVAWGNLQEKVGAAMIPLVEKLAPVLTDKVIPALSSLVDWVSRNADTIADWTPWVLGAVVALKGFSIINSLGIPAALKGVAGGIDNVGTSSMGSTGKVGAFVGKLGLLATAFAIVYEGGKALIQLLDDNKEMEGPAPTLTAQEDELAKAFLATGIVADELAGKIGELSATNAVTAASIPGFVGSLVTQAEAFGANSSEVIALQAAGDRYLEMVRKFGPDSLQATTALGLMHGAAVLATTGSDTLAASIAATSAEALAVPATTMTTLQGDKEDLQSKISIAESLIALLPAEKQTELRVLIAQAQANIQHIISLQQQLRDRTITYNVRTIYSNAGTSVRTTGGGAVGFAHGGLIHGTGGPTSDRVPILASPGEFMVNAAATRRNRDWLEAINNGASGAAMPAASAGGAGGTQVVEHRLTFDVRGGDDELIRLIRKWVRTEGL